MGEPRKFCISETIVGLDASTTTIDMHITDQVHRIDDRGPIIHGIRRCIRRCMRRSVDGVYRGPRGHIMEARIYPSGQNVTNNTEQPKVTLSISDQEMAALLSG